MYKIFTNRHGIQVHIPELLRSAESYARQLMRGRSLRGLESEDLAQCAMLAALPQLEDIHSSPQAFVRQRVLWRFLDLKRSARFETLAADTLHDISSDFCASPHRQVEARRLIDRLQQELGSEALLELGAVELASRPSNVGCTSARYRLRSKARAWKVLD